MCRIGKAGGQNPDCGFYRSGGRLVDGSGAVNSWKYAVISIISNVVYYSISKILWGYFGLAWHSLLAVKIHAKKYVLSALSFLIEGCCRLSTFVEVVAFNKS
jgi:hypothetical protein